MPKNSHSLQVQRTQAFFKLLEYLPPALSDELTHTFTVCDELRLRVGGLCSVTSSGKNIPLHHSLSVQELEQIFKKMCGGSLYAYRDTICRGYITIDGGIRVGVCGRAVLSGSEITALYDISSLCIRLPRRIVGIGGTVIRTLQKSGFKEGALIYSMPGVGKTTLLRAVTETLSKPPFSLRVALIDTRGELSACLDTGLSCDILSGYPKGKGIEIAARTLNPEFIICDELGADLSEAAAVKASHNCGVPLLASSHASDVKSLLRKSAIAELHSAYIFGYYIGISRTDTHDYTYTVTPRSYFDRLCI